MTNDTMRGRITEHPILDFKRGRKITIYFNGKAIPAFEGDTIAAALYAAGARIFSRSLKFHRPRGFFCAIGKCASCMMRVDGRPNVKTCVEYVRDGMRVETQSSWPSAKTDMYSVIDRVYRKGMDYDHMFIRPGFMAPLYQRVVRGFTGIGEIENSKSKPRPAKQGQVLETDVAGVGGGPAGLSAAIYAARTGARVILIDENPKLGGQLVKQTHKFFGSKEHYAGVRGIYISDILLGQAAELENLTVLNHATVFGVYPGKVLGVVREGGLIEVHAKSLVFAIGAYEKTIVFENWDMPGVYGAGGVQTLMNVYGTVPGKKGLMIGSGNVGVIVAYQLLQAGTDVVAVVEALPNIGAYAVHAAKLSRFGVPILLRHTVTRALGGKKVKGALISKLDDKWNPVKGTERKVDCDFICIATGLKPAAELLFQAGCKMKFVSPMGGHVPLRTVHQETSVKGVYVAGDTGGIEEASSAMMTGRIAGLSAAIGLGHGDENTVKLRDENYESLCGMRAGPFGERVRGCEGELLLGGSK
jgi:sarcosine oxidase subunit alpha